MLVDRDIQRLRRSLLSDPNNLQLQQGWASLAARVAWRFEGKTIAQWLDCLAEGRQVKSLLRQFQSLGPMAAPCLLRALQAPRGDVRDRALKVLFSLSKQQPELIPSLAALIHHQDISVRKAIIRWLSRNDTAISKAVALISLEQGLRDVDWQVRQMSAEALGALGHEAVPALDSLSQGLRDADQDVRGASLEALSKISLESFESGRRSSEWLLERFVPLLDDDCPWVRRGAVQALMRHDLCHHPNTQALVLGLGDVELVRSLLRPVLKRWSEETKAKALLMFLKGKQGQRSRALRAVSLERLATEDLRRTVLGLVERDFQARDEASLVSSLMCLIDLEGCTETCLDWVARVFESAELGEVSFVALMSLRRIRARWPEIDDTHVRDVGPAFLEALRSRLWRRFQSRGASDVRRRRRLALALFGLNQALDDGELYGLLFGLCEQPGWMGRWLRENWGERASFHS